MKNLIRLLSLLTISGFMLASCEGPQGVAGLPGKDGVDGAAGIDGIDANESCKECHNNEVLEPKATEFEFSKHSYGEAAFEEAGSTSCTPCHTSDAFKYVCANNTPTTFALNATTGKYSNSYVVPAGETLGEINCTTCHSKLHTSYTSEDWKPLTTTAAVTMTMWKGAKEINLTQDGGSSNLCIKCHQPRPLATSSTLSTGDVVDYAGLVSAPTTVYYDNVVGNAAPNKVIPSYRTHVHYGTVGAIYAGKGGVEFTGTVTYASSAHTAGASCYDCHGSAVTGRAGGHTFTAKGNFTSCNTTGCHSSPITSSSTTFWKSTRDEIKLLLDNLATKINAVGGGTNILHADADAESNLWVGQTSGNFDGYLNIYDPSTNPDGVWKNPGSTSSWTTAAKAINTALPTFPSLTSGVLGAMINFQMCLRESSLGIHNYKYSKALLQNSIETLAAQGL